MSNKESIFHKLLDTLIGGKDVDAAKKKQLKNIAKTLSKTHFKFYKPGSDQALPVMGKFFFDLYKALSSCQVLFNSQPNPNYYKDVSINFGLSEAQKALVEELSEEAIVENSKKMQFAQLKEKVKADISAFTGEFDQAKIQMIDGLYQKILLFKSFCTFDYYFILKKFDSTIRENEFTKTPKFNPIDASYIAEDLKDFLTVLYTLPIGEDWTSVLQLLKAMRGGNEPIKAGQLAKILARLNQIRTSRVFEMIIQLSTKNPLYEVKYEEKREQIVEGFIDKIKNEAQTTLKKIENAQKNSKADGLLKQIFGTTDISALQHYTDEQSAYFLKKNLGGFEYTKPLNYLKAFLLEYVKRDVRQYADLVLVRGKWATSPLTAEMSDAYNAILEYSEKITLFDKALSEEEGEYGKKLKTLLPRADRDKEAANIIRTTLRDNNAIAREYIVSATRQLILFAKTTKLLIEDYQKQRPELMTNWKELERFAETPIKELGVNVYKKIYLVVQLMQGLVGNGA
ncbi:DUF5312 family protein [Treponema ruminis]|uniref:Uncharacterized protein n=1 Tax=Treponema ruminis TaxID=744515 RepID=A0A7W8G931_9SPIR|nr:DUF5312 family protein [Treponema ruminis]MBB5226103.1 hypothetical protein [Treponema ruminis]